MMKFSEFLKFGVILKPKNKLKYSRMYKSGKEEKEELNGSEL